MLFTYISDNQLFLLWTTLIIIVIAVFVFHFNKKTIALILLFLGSFGLGLFIAGQDNFLAIWDEQYHALVAKNMMDNPFRPMLYSKPILDYNYENWTANHIWLHKQPLFLWQIALSLKIFGINELSVRIPSIFFHTVMTIMIFRIGKITVNSNIGFYGALFFSVAWYPLELVAGKLSTDHNDVAFLFYVTASFWSWFEYQNSQRKYWLVLIGIFSGCAVLVKWLAGLLIYATWVLSLGVNNKKNWIKWRNYLPVIISLTISLIIFVPWQLYILNKFPLEAAYEYRANTGHLYHVIEGHGGNFWFHINALKKLYGSGLLVPYFLLSGLIILVIRNINREYKTAVISAVLIVYVFYSIITTKMLSFCVIVAPFFFLGLGALIDSIATFFNSKIRKRHFEVVFRIVALITVSYLFINFSKIQKYHTDWKPHDNCNRVADIEQMKVIEKISELPDEAKYVIFNADIRLNGHIPVMFYTDHIAYNFIPNQEQIQKCKEQLYRIVILDKNDLPDYINSDKDILKIKGWL